MEYRAEVIGKKELNQKIIEIRFALKEPAEIIFKAGQFMMLEVGDIRRRPYSIISLPSQKNELAFCVDHSPNGAGSVFIRNLKVFESVEMQGPFGVFTVKDFSQNLVFIATGAGIAPFVSMIPDLLAAGFSKRLKLIFGVRARKDLPYDDLFLALEKKYNNFEFLCALTQPQKDWSGFIGRVTAFMKEKHLYDLDELYFICGGPEMVKDTRAVLLEREVPISRIKIEVFT